MGNYRLRVPCLPRQEATVSVLEKEIELIGSKGRGKMKALFDSGASYSIIRKDVAERLANLEALVDPDEWVFETARPGETIQASHRISLNIRFADSAARFSDEFIVFDECSEAVIIGAKTMQAWHIRLDFDKEEVIYRKTAERLRVI
jgi:hypothetical protein